MSWLSLSAAVAFFLVSIHVTTLPAAPDPLPFVSHSESSGPPVSFAETADTTVAPCLAGDRACEAVLLLRSVQGFRHTDVRAPRRPPQTPEETLVRRSGDPEALAILLSVLMDHRRIDNLLVFSLPRVYVLACGITPEELTHALTRVPQESLDARIAASLEQPAGLQDPWAFRIKDQPCLLLDPSSPGIPPGTPLPLTAPLRRAVDLSGVRLTLSPIPVSPETVSPADF